MAKAQFASFNKRKDDFEKMGLEFQERLVHLILTDRAFSDRIGEVIDYEYFAQQHLRQVVEIFYNLREEFDVQPSKHTIRTTVNLDVKDELLKKKINDYLDRTVFDEDARIIDADFVKERSIDFCRKKEVESGIIEVANLLNQGGAISFDDISGILERSLKLGSDNDVGYDYFKDFLKRFEEESRNPISSGLSLFDNLIAGGFGRSELNVLLAPTNSGKTTTMCFFGAQAWMAGKTVVHYTLEEKDTKIGNKYDSCISKISLNQLFSKQDEVMAKIKMRMAKHQNPLIIKEYPTKTASPRTIQNHLNRLIQRGIYPDLVIIDYADLLKPSKYGENNRSNLQGIYEELRSLAMQLDIPILTASQTNRTGQDAPVVKMDMISEAFAKCFVADLIFTLGRTTQDKENFTARFHFAKNRNGPTGDVLELAMDPEYVSIRQMGLTTVGEIEQVSEEQTRTNRLQKALNGLKK